MLAFMLWLGIACLVWLSAIFLLIVKRTRPLAGPLSLAMAATFPGVWIFQIAAAPFVLGILLIAAAIWRILEPNMPQTTDNPFAIGTFFAAVLIDFILVLGMSIIGFYEGWRTGWLCAKGRRWHDVIQEGPTAKLIFSTRNRLKARKD
jgi:hypothetical protein